MERELDIGISWPRLRPLLFLVNTIPVTIERCSQGTADYVCEN